MTFAHPKRALNRAAPAIPRHNVEWGKAARASVYYARLRSQNRLLPRFHREQKQVEHSPKVAEYLRSAFEENPLQEAFYCVYLDRKNHPLGRHLVSLGTATSTLTGPREVFRGAILSGATAMIVAHNHPSGDPSPSNADLQVTRQLKEAAKIMDIELLDHVIIGNTNADPAGLGYYSLREHGVI